MKNVAISAFLFICTWLGALAPAPLYAGTNVSMSDEQLRYKENPIYLFFESYILDVIDELPAERFDRIQSMNLQNVFNTKSSEWRAVIRETLHLSNTIDIAILDLWYRNQAIAKAQGITYAPEHFAVNFTDEYMKDGSQVDVWPPGALEAAKRRIAAARRDG